MTKMMHNGHYVGGWRWDAKLGRESFSKLRKAYGDLLSFSDKIAPTQAELARGQLHTKAGIRAEMAKFVSGEGRAAAEYLRTAIAVAEREIASLRGEIQSAAQKPIDKADLAAALLRQELRAHVRGMTDSARVGMMNSPDLDPAFAAAILEAPAVVSGITPAQRDRMLAKLGEIALPEKFADLADLQDAIGAAELALRAVVKSCEKHAGMSPADIHDGLGIGSGNRLSAILASIEEVYPSVEHEDHLAGVEQA